VDHLLGHRQTLPDALAAPWAEAELQRLRLAKADLAQDRRALHRPTSDDPPGRRMAPGGTSIGGAMLNADAKKTVLRMIPYGIYILTADDGKGGIAAATVNWVTQSAFSPPLVVVGVKADSGAYAIVKAGGHFALNMLGKDQKALAFTFFRPADLSDGKISGQAYRTGETGAPILIDALGAVECRVTGIVEQGDHHVVVGEVVQAILERPVAGRPDAAILEMKDLGDNVFYGG
jgi:flavin reductase (DIM6/NTAB) family NADH-FMN oxidoreductase RutF